MEIRENQQLLSFIFTNVRVYVGVIRGIRLICATGDDHAFLAKGNEVPIVRKNPARGLFLFDADPILTGRVQPGRPDSEPNALTRAPLYGGPSVATRFPADNCECLLLTAARLDELSIRVVRLDIDVIRYLGVAGIGRAGFLAHIGEQRVSRGVDDGREHDRGLDATASQIVESADDA